MEPPERSFAPSRTFRTTGTDVLSEVLHLIHPSGAGLFTAEFSAPWALDSAHSALRASVPIPPTDCVVLFHIVVKGECVVHCPPHPGVSIQAGDVVVFPHGNSRSNESPDVSTTPLRTAVFAPVPPDELPLVPSGGPGPTARLICGYLNCDRRFVPVMSALPIMLVLRSTDGYTAIEGLDGVGRHPIVVPRGSDTWLSTTVKFTVNEAGSARPGNADMLGRLIELMFVQIVRDFIQQLPPERCRWLTGLKDAHVGEALRLVHAHPTRNWTVDELAHAAAISRSGLAQRFTKLVGQPPMRYLATWRIQLAKQMLGEGAHSVQEVASRVGYESEAAFNRAFKRHAGAPPAAWRRAALHASGSDDAG